MAGLPGETMGGHEALMQRFQEYVEYMAQGEEPSSRDIIAQGSRGARLSVGGSPFMVTRVRYFVLREIDPETSEIVEGDGPNDRYYAVNGIMPSVDGRGQDTLWAVHFHPNNLRAPFTGYLGDASGELSDDAIERMMGELNAAEARNDIF